MEPCDTPHVVSLAVDEAPEIFIVCSLPDK